MNNGVQNMAAGSDGRKIEDRIKTDKNCHVMEYGEGGFILLCGIYGEIE